MLSSDLSKVVVKVIPVELLLSWVSSQVLSIFFEFRVIQVLPLFINVFGVEVIFRWRYERRSYSFVLKIVPGKVFEPRMSLYFVCTVVSQSILGLSLNHFVDKVSSFNRPVSWNFSLFNLNLFLKNVVSYLLSWFSNVRSSSKHALVSHNSHCKVIYTSSVVDSAHDFWRHVAWSSRSVLGVLWPPNSSNTKVRDSKVSILINY